MHKPPAPQATLRLADRFTTEVMPAKGWTSVSQAAHACGLSHTTLSRVIRGEVAPGHIVVAALITGTGEPFERLFTIA